MKKSRYTEKRIAFVLREAGCWCEKEFSMTHATGEDRSLAQLPERGFVFWPVGTGDSTTVCIDEETVIQIDLHHLEKSESVDDGRVPIIEELVELLPKRNSKPYLSVFVLTHPDLDHCRGFELLKQRVIIGELWFAPRIFREKRDGLCDDAISFRLEAKRRVKTTIEAGGTADAGDRVRIIGYSDLLGEDDFEGFPEERLQSPGDKICEVDGEDKSGRMCAFVHAPFKDDDVASERNETSVGLRIELRDGSKSARALLLGDLSYPTIRRVFDESKSHGNDAAVHWDVLLAPHQCSKSVMYWKGEGEDEATLRQDILDDIEKAAENNGYVVASSNPIPSSNKDGDNPPHAIAKERYEEIAPDGFVCTCEHGGVESPKPVVFQLGTTGAVHDSKAASRSATSSALAAGIETARGEPEPPSTPVGYGRCR